MEEFAAILWSLWTARNQWVFENKLLHVEEVIHRAVIYLGAFQKVTEKRHLIAQEQGRTLQRWKPPDEDTFKVNVDGAFKDDRAGIGAIIRDAAGNIMATMAAPMQAVYSPQLLKALAILKGIELAHDTALKNFCIDSDYLGVVNSVNTAGADFFDIGHVLTTIKRAIGNPFCRGLSHVNKAANYPAHILAKYARDLAETLVWIEDGPDCIKLATLADLA